MQAVAKFAEADNDRSQLLAVFFVAMHAGRYFFFVTEKKLAGQADDQVYALFVISVSVVLSIKNFTQVNDAIINRHGRQLIDDCFYHF